MSSTGLHTPVAVAAAAPLRHDWTREEIRALFDLPLSELIFRAQSIHRIHFDPSEVQLSTLLSIKTGGCPEDCAYCPQSAQYDTGVHAEKLMPLDKVLAEARAARDAGASRFCMGAAWRSPKERDLDQVCAMVEGVKALGLETCVTLGMLTAPQAEQAQGRGPRLLQSQSRHLAGILRQDHHHADLPGSPGDAGACAHRRHPCLLWRHRRHGRDARGPHRHDRDAGEFAGASRNRCRSTCWSASPARRWRTQPPLEPIEFVRTIAVARITMPQSMVRLSAGRESMSEETQALCFLAGANSIFCGPKLLTTPNPKRDRDPA